MSATRLARLDWRGQPRWAIAPLPKQATPYRLLPESHIFGDLLPAPSEWVAADDVRLLIPLETGARVFCVGRNYRAHAVEIAADLPESPSWFTRLPGSLVAHGEPLVHPGAIGSFDFEGEIALILARGGRDLSLAEARAAIGGITLAMDGSVRTAQRDSLFAGKNYERSGALGPAVTLLPPDADLGSLTVNTRINGQTTQQGTLADLIFPAETLIAHLSRILPLRAGDVISTGTPEGIGMSRNPPLWLTPGDRVEVACPDIGKLQNNVT